jgi:hypothetical protein
MSWAIADAARMSGVTVHTLRHHDDIGVLKPAYVGTNGYRGSTSVWAGSATGWRGWPMLWARDRSRATRACEPGPAA